MDVTIVVCTHNNSESLRRTLDALSGLHLPERLGCELLVVDNASTDSTPAAVKDCAPPRAEVRYLYEPRRGLSHARNTATAAARGRFLLWTDDDARPPRDWVEGMCAPLLSGSAHAVAGGVKIPTALERPWMSGIHRAWLASTEHLDARSPGRMIGANMAFSKEILSKVPAFDTELGAGALGFHDETLFSYQLTRAGYSLVSAFDVAIEHHFDASRLRREHFLNSAEKMGRSDAYWAHHWEHETIEEPERLLESAVCRLAGWRLRHGEEWAGPEGAAERELELVHEVYLYEQYLIERRRPRNYEKFGLVKRPVPGVSA
jgi:glycosyltransferase involved in cell wall biosynthesis